MAITSLSNECAIVYGAGTTISTTAVTDVLSLLTAVKTAPATINIGNVLTYTCLITNINIIASGTGAFTDVLPTGCTYVSGSFHVNGSAATATLTGQTLTATLPSIPALGTQTVTFDVNVTG